MHHPVPHQVAVVRKHFLTRDTPNRDVQKHRATWMLALIIYLSQPVFVFSSEIC
jgi:hypothetical protein